MDELYNYLKTTTYDLTFILISQPFGISVNKNRIYTVEVNILRQFSVLKIDPLYKLTYEFLKITSDEIIKFYLENITKEIPYLVNYKKKYLERVPWWYPCKQISLISPMADIDVFIKYSLAPLQRTYGNLTRNDRRGFQPFIYGKVV